MSNGLRSSADTATRRRTAPGRGTSSPTGSQHRGNTSVVWTLIALAMVTGSLYAIRADSEGDSLVGWSLAGGASSGTIKVSGYSRGLFPGARTYLRAKVKNGSSRAVTMTWIRVRTGTGGPGCPSRTLRVGGFTGRRLVGSGRTWRLWLPITMKPWAGEACQGARYPLTFIFGAKGR